jgi:hypothetical protein
MTPIAVQEVISKNDEELLLFAIEWLRQRLFV